MPPNTKITTPISRLTKVRVTPAGVCTFTVSSSKQTMTLDFASIIGVYPQPQTKDQGAHLFVGWPIYMQYHEAVLICQVYRKWINLRAQSLAVKKRAELDERKRQRERALRVPLKKQEVAAESSSSGESDSGSDSESESESESETTTKRQRTDSDDDSESDTDPWEEINKKLLESLICPLTGKPFEDPVMAADGHTYSRSAFEAYIRTNRTTRASRANKRGLCAGDKIKSPVTGTVLKNYNVVPNETVQKILTILS